MRPKDSSSSDTGLQWHGTFGSGLRRRRKVVLERDPLLPGSTRRVSILGSSRGGTGKRRYPEAGVFTEIQVGSYVFMDVYYIDAVMRRDIPSSHASRGHSRQRGAAGFFRHY